MHKTRNILFNTAFFFNSLLLFLLLFYDKLIIPSWVQVIGRMHPMILHFPLVLLILYIAWTVWLSKKINTQHSKDIADTLLLFAALSAVLTAIMGLLLSKESGYDSDALFLHKWSGVSLAFISFTWYILRDKISQIKFVPAIMAMIVFALLLLTADLGAGITHGDDFILAPVLPEKKPKQVALEDAVVFTDMVQPILQSKCISCHNSKKAKGELIMETEALLKKGGKDGPIWDTADASMSLMLKRIHLPEEEEKHMPPQGKPQLSADEISIFYYWIKNGASFTLKVMTIPANDSLRLFANNLFKATSEEVYDFAAADEKIIQQLNNNNRVVTKLSLTSPALAVDFYNSENYDGQLLKDLLKVKDQVVSLNLAHMPVKDEDLTTIAQFINLRKLNLNFTSVTGKNLASLNKLQHLNEIALAATSITAKDIQSLVAAPKLKDVFVWNTSLTSDDAKRLATANAALHIQTGFKSDTVVMKLTPPILQNQKQVIEQSLPLKLKHYINGTSIRYTIDGTDPDSLASPLYDNKVILTKNGLLKAKAFKPGWISSDIMQAYFYKSTYTADSVILLTPPDQQYKGDGGKTLIDRVKSDQNFRNGKWLGYHGTKMEALLMFNDPVQVQSVTLSSLVDVGGYIMPPQSIEIWGGNDEHHLKLLTRNVPKQPGKIEPGYMIGFDCSFKPVSVKYIKVVGTAISKLPAWHPGKGDKGWLFTDEIFVN